MTAKRSYGDQCGVARALDLVGDRWALLVVRELLFGPKRFTDLRAGLPHVAPDVLSQRLRELEGAGILRRRTLDPPASTRVYELTDRGHELEPVLIELGRWGAAAPFPSAGAVFGADSMVLALKTMFAPDRAAGVDTSYELRLGGEPFAIDIRAGELAVRRGSPDAPDAAVETEVGTLAEVLWRGRSLDASLEAGELRIEGSRRTARRFFGLFPVPSRA